MSEQLRLTVLSAGYLGTTHASCMADIGFDVHGVGTDAHVEHAASAAVDSRQGARAF